MGSEHSKEWATFKKTELGQIFLGPRRQPKKVPRLGVKSELQVSVYTTATATLEPSHICNLHRSLGQHQILNPLSKAGD